MANQSKSSTFLTPPPELRLKVFRVYFRAMSLTFVPLMYGSPALLRVSKAVRAESLPSFYGESRFILDVRPAPAPGRRAPPVFGRRCVQQIVDPGSMKYYLGLSIEHLGLIRQIQLRSGGCGVGRVAINVNLSNSGVERKQKCFNVELMDLVKGEERVHVFSGCVWEIVIMGQLERLVQDIAEREGRFKLRSNDVGAFAVALTL